MTGSMTNLLMQRSGNPRPEVGMGATMLGWTDRHGATVVGVSASGKTIKVQRDRATRVDSNGMSESQDYTFERNPDAKVMTYRMTKRGWHSRSEGYLSLGERSEYYDFSF